MPVPAPRTRLVDIRRSSRPSKKLMAVFEDGAGRTQQTHFGAAGYGDYTTYWRRDPAVARAKRQQYIARHRVLETWTDPTAASTLARYILWERPTVRDATTRFRRAFRV